MNKKMKGILCLWGFMTIISPVYGQSISVPVGTVPVLDGQLQPGEWSDAVTEDISSTSLVPAGTVTLYLKYSDTGRYLWWAIDDTNDTNFENEDQTGTWFDDDNTDSWDQTLASDEGANYVMWNETDAEIQYSFAKLTDIDTKISRWPAAMTTNVTGSLSDASGHVQYEAQVDLFWPPDGDPNSELQYPFGGDTIGSLFFCSDKSTGITGIWPSTATTDPSTFGDLQFQGLTDPPPNAPSNLAGTVLPSNQLDLSWTPPADNIDGSTPTGLISYNVYRKEKNGTYGLLQSGLISPSFSDTTRVAGTLYLYAVTAVNSSSHEGPPGNVYEEAVVSSIGTQPTVDGVINAIEWADARVIDISNTAEGIPANSVHLYVKNSSNGRYLWLAVKDDTDTALEENDGFNIWHDDDHDHYWILSSTPGCLHEGYDQVGYNAVSAEFDVMFRGYVNNNTSATVQSGSLMFCSDMDIVASDSRGRLEYETCIDLFWPPGNDPNPGYQYPFGGDISGLRIEVRNENSGTPVITGLWPPGSTENPLTFFDLKFPPLTNPPPNPPMDVTHTTMAPNHFNLFWTAPTERIDGTPITGSLTYNVYKRLETDDYALWRTDLPGTSVSDRTSPPGGYYYYTVTAVEDLTHESAPADAQADYAGGVGIIDSSPGATMSIDGVFVTPEWSGATELYIPDGAVVDFPYYLYQQHDYDFMYICLDVVGAKTYSGSNYAGVYFDAGGDGILANNSEDSIIVLKNLKTMHQLYSTISKNWITHTSGTSGVPFTETDRDQAGMIAAIGFGPSPNDAEDHFIYEFKIPMALGDINTAVGSSVRVYYYIMAGTEESYWTRSVNYAAAETYGQVNLVGTLIPIDETPLIVVLLLGFCAVLCFSSMYFMGSAHTSADN